MIDSRFIIALGYPIGVALKKPNNIECLAEINNKIHSLNVSAYRLWSCCLGGITIPKLIDLLKMQDTDLLNSHIDYLAYIQHPFPLFEDIFLLPVEYPHHGETKHLGFTSKASRY